MASPLSPHGIGFAFPHFVTMQAITLPASWYTNSVVYKQEIKYVLGNSWQVGCTLQIPEQLDMASLPKVLNFIFCAMLCLKATGLQ
jgi:hypothetical protein